MCQTPDVEADTPRARLAAHDLHGLGRQRAGGAGAMLRHARRHRWSGHPRPPCPPRPLSLDGKAGRCGGGGQGALWAAGGAGDCTCTRHGRLLTSILTAARQEADAGQQTGSWARPLPTSPPGPQLALTFPVLKRLRTWGARWGGGGC